MRNIINGISNLIYWFKIIWKDRDWDYSFLLTILKHKLESMEDFFLSEDVTSVGAEKEAFTIRKTKLVVDRMLYRDYFFNGELVKKDLKKSLKKAAYMENQDREYLGLMLRKHLPTWWD